MDNEKFLGIINSSFQVYLKTGARSNKKLKVLHGFVAEALARGLGEGYNVKSLGFHEGKEQNVGGRYASKKVDVVVLKDGKVVAGIAVKFVMSNYSQNSNNYFENMLGETANIRCNGTPYFQILILTQNAPYFKKGGTISKLEEITENNLRKYVLLSEDDTSIYLHSPDKTLIYIVKMTDNSAAFVGKSRKYYAAQFANNSRFQIACIDGVSFGKNVVCNDFEEYIKEIVHRVLSI